MNAKPSDFAGHTPGPWHVEKSVGRFELWPKDNGQAHSYVGIAQREVDARLIASAPDLLAERDRLMATIIGAIDRLDRGFAAADVATRLRSAIG